MPKQTRFEKLKKERRYVRVPVDLDLLGEMIVPAKSTPDYQLRIEGLPEDSLFVSAAQSLMERGVSFFYMHESFESVPVGIEAPIHYVTVTRIDRR